MLLQVSILFDIVFLCQRFVLYPHNDPQVSQKLIDENTEPLVKSSHHQLSANV